MPDQPAPHSPPPTHTGAAGPQQARAVLHELDRLIADRVRAEGAIRKELRSAALAAEREHEAARAAIAERAEREVTETGAQHQEAVARTAERFENARAALKASTATRQQDLTSTTEAEENAAREGLREKVWVAETIYEANEGKPRAEYELVKKELQARAKELTALETVATWLLKKFRQPVPAAGSGVEQPAAAPADAPADLESARRRFEKSLAETGALVYRLRRMILPRIMGVAGAAFLVLVITAAVEGLALWREGWKQTPVTNIAWGAGIVLALGITIGLILVSRRRVRAVRGPLLEAIARAKADLERALAQAAQRRDGAAAALVQNRVTEVQAAKEKFEPIAVAARRKRDEGFKSLQQEYANKRGATQTRRDAEQAEADQKKAARLKEAEEQRERGAREADERRERTLAAAQQKHDEAWAAMESEWKSGMARVHGAVAVLDRDTRELFKDWADPGWSSWSPAREADGEGVTHARFGSLHVDIGAIKGGTPEDERLRVPGPARFALPADLSLPDRFSLLIKSAPDGAGRAQAIRALQAVMLRLVTVFPPGKVRFTILDPVGLGQSFAGFMHLADYDEALVGGKIWTEARHIEQRLTDLTEHMENVIQKYLRNEFATIGEYNVQAGEIAEPYRFLVIADFPVNFNDASAKRLASIVASGARCGVHTLIAYDARQPLPQGVAMSDIEAGSAKLVWRKDARPAHPGEPGAFVYDDADFSRWPLTLDEPPGDEAVSRIVHAVGTAAKDATRVQVPFETIAPAPERLWSLECDSELRVPLGRAGATKLQQLALGKGTSQHVLIAGKTGSGKSTLLHALITSLSLWYSPEEVELYLVDFKKGVEFKCYATYSLPHARAVAIESDREFGLSVLHRLDAELKRRGNLYRDLHVQDLAGYRAAIKAGKGQPGMPKRLPRILLIIDEFQEFFTEDDKLAQDASLLMDRLVRQGRAFGMHVLLGSQTLSGAYSLARSTMGQMAVRIALQCSEADSYLILSEDNGAARLLSRPGEAIYNDSSGLVEGNSPFQIVWLPEGVRERNLKVVAERASREGLLHPERQAVFEGNVPADIARNHGLESLLTGAARPAPQAPVRAWLGEAIAIKDPTAAVLRRQAAGNLLIVGQREEVSLAMLASSMVSLAAHDREGKGGTRLYILDGAPPDDPHAGYLARLAAALPQAGHRILVAGPREAAAAMEQLGAELSRREADPSVAQDPVYLLIYGLHRFRNLKKPEDEFSFSMGDKEAPARPDQHLARLIREGPALGMHALVWCDTAGTMTRWLDRQVLREFDSRVLLQMSAADSTALIDAPDAGKLGMHRALLFTEEQGGVEKFRPYALPAEHWLAALVSGVVVRAGTPEPEVR